MNLSSEQLFLTESAKALLENQDQSPFLNLSQYQLWDIAGVDGLQLAKLLVSDVVAKIAPFQSIDVVFTGYQYSALRLCEGNFRLGLYGELGAYGGLNFEETIKQAQTGLRAWARRCDTMKAKNATASRCAIALPESVAGNILPKIAVVKPPHRLEGLQRNCAVPARIDGISVLIWRHQLLSQPVFELHTAVGDYQAIKVKLKSR